MPDAIVLKGLTKTFGDTVAVRDLDLVVPQGALYGVIGPNGAGKTTTIRMILSIQMPDRGELSVLGHRSAMEAKDQIGYLPEERGLYKRMRVGHFLAYMARLKGDDGLDLETRVKTWLERVDLGEVANKRCEELSKGMQQKVQFLTAVMHRPSLIILDEPFSGLDPVNQRLLRDLVLEEHARGATVLFSTHVMVYAEQLCDHIVMIHRGLKVLDDTLGNIRSRFAPRSILFEPLDAAADAGALASIPGIAGVQQDGEAWEFQMAPSAQPGTVMQAMAAAMPPLRLELRRPTLEDLFIDIVSGESADAGTLRAAVREHGSAHAGGRA
jgi:ABC-2 type transport system ATP-binding protein